MFKKILLVTLFPIITLGGLAASPLYIVYLITVLFGANKAQLINRQHFTSPLATFFLIFAFISLVSTTLSFNILGALKSWIIIWPLILSFFLIKKFDFVNINFFPYLITGFSLAIIVGIIEMVTHGGITMFFHQHFFKPNHPWFLHDLNRGMTFLALAIWPIMLGMLSKGVNIKTILFSGILYLINYGLIANSESLSAELALILSLTVSIIIYFIPKLAKLYYWLFLLSIPLMLGVFLIIEPDQLRQQLDFLPLSAIHRLYIWHYCAERMLDYPFGVGFNGARFVPFAAMEVHPIWGPLLPLHTHNHLLQFVVEFGIMGILALMYYYHLILKHILSLENKLVLSLSLGMLSCHYIISLISYGVWQQWWIATTILYTVWFKQIAKNKLELQLKN